VSAQAVTELDNKTALPAASSGAAYSIFSTHPCLPDKKTFVPSHPSGTPFVS